MPRNKRFATTLEMHVVPYLESLETYWAGAGLKPSDYSSYTQIRKRLTEFAKIVRAGGHLWAPSADAALNELNSLQDALPTILRRMPPGFTHEWNIIAGRVESDHRAMTEESD